jgi:hypothetical protein
LEYLADQSLINSPKAAPDMTISSGVPSGWGDGLGDLDGTDKLDPCPRRRPKRLGGFDELLEWVLGEMLGVEDREGGTDGVGVAYSSRPPGKTIL